MKHEQIDFKGHNMFNEEFYENNINSREAQDYLASTSWIWEKYNRNVLILKSISEEDFKLKYSEIIKTQEECRKILSTLDEL